MSSPDTSAADTSASEASVRATLRTRLSEARAAWSSTVVSDEAFLDHALEKVQNRKEGQDAAAFAQSLRIADLYLAFACGRGDQVAMARFEQLYFSEIDAACRRFDSLPISPAEARQRMREKLFLASPADPDKMSGRPPGLLGYAGHGDLRGWLRAATLHALLNVTTRETREQPTDDRFFEAVIDAGSNAETAYLKGACKSEFESAFRVAIEKLSDRQRSLLRYAFTDGLNVDQIGAIFRVHRATAARWVADARSTLLDETRAELMNRLRISVVDAESIMRAAMSQISGSLLARFGEYLE
jgi:RNA polymerase sigma-70 factor, ECF subfamily